MRRRNPGRIAVLIVLAVIGTFLLLVSLAKRGECAWYGHETKRVTSYSFLVGCMVETPGGFVPRSELRVVQ